MVCAVDNGKPACSKDIIHVSMKEKYSSPGGGDCFYIKLGDSGIKCFTCEDVRDRAVSNQQRLGKYAPEVITTDVTVMVGSRIYWAYETEHVEALADYDNEYDDATWKRFNEAGIALAAKLLKEENVVWIDCHTGNVGFNSFGDPVVIDCADKMYPSDREGVAEHSRI
jgi:hypothetical protein